MGNQDVGVHNIIKSEEWDSVARCKMLEAVEKFNWYPHIAEYSASADSGTPQTDPAEVLKHLQSVKNGKANLMPESDRKKRLSFEVFVAFWKSILI